MAREVRGQGLNPGLLRCESNNLTTGPPQRPMGTGLTAAVKQANMTPMLQNTEAMLITCERNLGLDCRGFFVSFYQCCGLIRYLSKKKKRRANHKQFRTPKTSHSRRPSQPSPLNKARRGGYGMQGFGAWKITKRSEKHSTTTKPQIR